MPYPTIRSIAKEASVSDCTVSRALRGDRRISLETRTRVQALAMKMGYRLNPAVSSWMAHVRSTKVNISFQGCLALLDFHTTSQPLSSYPTPRRQIEGATLRAKELGYQLEHFPVYQGRLSPERLTQILESRSIKGALIPVSAALSKINFSFEPFALGAIGHRTTSPPMHFTSNDQYATMLIACEEMTRLGYKRVGAVLGAGTDKNVEQRFSGAYLGWQQRIPAASRLPIFFYDFELDEKKLLKWCRSQKPDAILCFDINAPTDSPRTILERHFRIPEDIALADLDWNDRSPGLAGVDQGHEMAGAAAVDLVVGQLHQNECGIPKTARGVFIEGTWRPGATAPARL
jgi:DNA-binding LacI/PurR family transcriptional regulator